MSERDLMAEIIHEARCSCGDGAFALDYATADALINESFGRLPELYVAELTSRIGEPTTIRVNRRSDDVPVFIGQSSAAFANTTRGSLESCPTT